MHSPSLQCWVVHFTKVMQPNSYCNNSTAGVMMREKLILISQNPVTKETNGVGPLPTSIY